MDSKLEALIAENRVAVAAFVSAAEAVPKRDWSTSPAEGKWSPGQHVHHVALVYGGVARELEQGQPARLVGSALKRRLWRLVGLTQVVWRGTLPFGAKSPREFRPPDGTPGRPALLAELRERVAEYERVMTAMIEREPGRQVMHPYFGAISLGQALKVLAVHTRHHTKAIIGTSR